MYGMLLSNLHIFKNIFTVLFTFYTNTPLTHPFESCILHTTPAAINKFFGKILAEYLTTLFGRSGRVILNLFFFLAQIWF